MKKLLLTSVGMAMLACSGSANAAEMVFLWDYDSPTQTLRGITSQDGTVVQNVAVGAQYTGGYTLFNSESLTTNLNLAFNIFDGGGNLLHTWAVTGSAGNTFFNTPFLNGELAALTPLAGGTAFIANGSIQTVGGFAAGRDNYTLQFRTNAILDGAVPEPATWAMMLIGFGAIGAAVRRQRKATVKVSYA